MGTVHQFHDLTVDAPGSNAQLPPKFLPFQGCPLDEEELSMLLPELGQTFFPHFDGNIFCSSLMANPGTSPFAVARKSSATPRAWSEWAEVPAAIMRTKLRAEMVSAVAPQIPRRLVFSASVSAFFLGAGTRQGPMEQFLQQLPSAPMGQGFISSARSKTVLTPSALAFSSTFRVAGSTLFVSAIEIILLLKKAIRHQLPAKTKSIHPEIFCLG
jgi:hypothetical protein